MRKAFTIIELIFVIVIIGVLLAVAIPKLSITRTDAKISAEMQSAKIALNNLGAEFTTKNMFAAYTKDNANKAVKCFIFDTNGVGDVEIEMITAVNAECPTDVYTAVKELASGNILTSTGSKRTYRFGGSTIIK